MDCANSSWVSICECPNASSLRWKEANVDGFVIPYYIDNSYSPEQKIMIRKAFADIQAIACIDFEESSTPDTRINFRTEVIDLETLAQAEFYQAVQDPDCIIQANIIKNSQYDADFTADLGYFYAVMLHEIIHALGVDAHSLNPIDVMYSSINNVTYVTEFGPWDLTEIFARYCMRLNA